MKPREFWITFKPFIVDPLGPCTNVLKYVATFAHEHGLHVIEKSAYDALASELARVKAENAEAKELLEELVDILDHGDSRKEIDSFTAQPASIFLARTQPALDEDKLNEPNKETK